MLSKALVLPHFDYCSNVWTNSSKTNVSYLQIQHNKLARVLLNADYLTPIDEMLNDLCWSRLHKRWDLAMYCCIFKCLMNLAPNYLSTNFMYSSSMHSYPTRFQESASLVIPKFDSCSGLRTFHSRAVKLWNSIPGDIRINVQSTSISLTAFKHIINELVQFVDA